MHALVRGAVAVALLGALGSPAETPAVRRNAPASDASTEAPASPDRLCPPGTVPDALAYASRADACLPVPSGRDPSRGARLGRLGAGPPARAELRIGSAEEWIARMPGRPEAFDAYELPVEHDAVIEEASAEPGGPVRGLAIALESATAVKAVELEGQVAATRVALVGELHGITVITLHRVQDAEHERTYAVVYGRLTRPGPGVIAGAELAASAVVGFAGEDDGPGELYFEVRELAAGAKLGRHLSSLMNPAVSVPVDPRNVLALR